MAGTINALIPITCGSRSSSKTQLDVDTPTHAHSARTGHCGVNKGLSIDYFLVLDLSENVKAKAQLG